MPNPPLDREEAERRIKVYHQCVGDGFGTPGAVLGSKGSAVEEAARRLEMNHTGIRRAAQVLKFDLREAKPKPPQAELPTFPDDDLPVEELLTLAETRFQKRYEYKRAKRWFPIKIRIDGPIGLSAFGDPHLDNNGCNWPLLRRDCEIHRKTPGLFGFNIGDTTDNWVGRLARLFAKSDTSNQTARKYAKWFLSDSGVTWLLWLMGNHDAWNEGDAILKAMGGHAVPMEDWQAQFKLIFPNGKECRIWAAHNFPGHSQWNTLHGPQKAAHTKDWAHVYACGHTHNWALHQEESASKEFTYWLMRARGYKFLDEHADQLGHASQQEGAAVTAIIDPDSKSMCGFVTCFADLEAAADYLTYLRKRRKCK